MLLAWKPRPGGFYDGVYALLLCRVTLGKFYYTLAPPLQVYLKILYDAEDRDTEAGDKVRAGDFDSTLGAAEKAHKNHIKPLENPLNPFKAP